MPVPDSSLLRAASDLSYRTAESAQSGFETNGILFAAYEIGDQLQRNLIDLIFDALTLKVLDPEYVIQMLNLLTERSKDALSAFSTPQTGWLTVEEIRNNFSVVGFVNGTKAPDRLSSDGRYPLERELSAAYAQGSYAALWAVEGLGQNYARAWLRKDPCLRGLLSAGDGAKLPEASLLMMHAGMGIALAKEAITRLTPGSTAREFNGAIRWFLDAALGNSRPGYVGPVLESLGLVTRTWHRQLVLPLAHHLQLADAEAHEFFWHGAGRAMYFSPWNMIPGFSPWIAAQREPPDDNARRNARAGVAWAFTLVSRRQPQIMADFLARQAGYISMDDACTDGILSALIMASVLTPTDTFVDAFCRYWPASNDAANLWDRFIGADCGSKVSVTKTRLSSQNALGKIFRYHSIPALLGENQPAPQWNRPQGAYTVSPNR